MHVLSGQVIDLVKVFGASPGDDHVLIDWDEMCDWIDDITSVSPHLTSETLGMSTDGRELRMVVASSPTTLADLDQIRQQRSRLKCADPYTDPANKHGRLAGTKPIVLITAGIHATEIGGVQMMPAFIRDLAVDARYHELFDHIILLVVPTINPDGMDMVHAWYRRTMDTNAEGTNPPEIYHRYAGHDNNRDWYQQHLQETRVIVDEVHRVWFPHVVVDLHQMGQKSPRYVVPPYIDPAEPHVHPLIYQLAAELGSKIVADHTRAGNRGVCGGVMFDCYSPTRAYQHYHGGVRILAEAASTAIASPVHLSEEELSHWPGATPPFPSVHMSMPWRGGSWHLSHIIQLHRQTIDTVLETVASDPDRWIADQWRLLADQMASPNSGAFVIPPLKQQIDPAAACELVDIMRNGDVEVYIAEKDDGDTQAGSFVIPVQQPFGSYASALLSLSVYPPGQQAYDVTSHCLPIHMGVEVEFRESPCAGGLRAPTDTDLTPFTPAQAMDVRPGAWLAIDPRGSAAIRLVNHALRTGSDVQRLEKPHVADRRLIQAGSWLIADTSVWDVMAHASRLHVRTSVIEPIPSDLSRIRLPRIGLYNPQHGAANDYGWLTLWLERAGFVFDVVTGEDVIHGGLDRIDTLLFPHVKPEHLIQQYAGQPYPAEFTRGLSDRVTFALRTWLHRGGHLIAFEGAVTALCQQLEISLHQPLRRLPDEAFGSSGTVVKVTPVAGEELTLGIHEPFPGMYFAPFGFELSDSGNQHVIARFARNGTVISGGMHGEKHLAGLHAVVQTIISQGQFTAFAFRPHFRTQMTASEQILTNAIMQQFDTDRTYS